MKVPDRWYNYKSHGRIRGTRFIAFKVPLREGFNRNMAASQRFTPADLLQAHPNIKMVIDLTYTRKYYNGKKEFEKNGVRYVKIFCKGHDVPSNDKYEQFAEIVHEFLLCSRRDYLIGVHCTHGVNRTGYFIVRYMIERLGYSSQQALKIFHNSRGHAIERTNYIADLHRRGNGASSDNGKARLYPIPIFYCLITLFNYCINTCVVLLQRTWNCFS